jgi:hypothetical protein
LDDAVAYALDYAAGLCVWDVEQKQKAQERDFQTRTMAAMLGVELDNDIGSGLFDSQGRLNMDDEDVV